jgi:exodeoxyribonuclease VII small subunit
MSAKSNSGIQDKMKQLEELVEWFESSDVDVDEALKNYEKAMKLASELENEIKSAKNEFTKIKKSFDK